MTAIHRIPVKVEMDVCGVKASALMTEVSIVILASMQVSSHCLLNFTPSRIQAISLIFTHSVQWFSQSDIYR